MMDTKIRQYMTSQKTFCIVHRVKKFGYVEKGITLNRTLVDKEIKEKKLKKGTQEYEEFLKSKLSVFNSRSIEVVYSKKTHHKSILVHCVRATSVGDAIRKFFSPKFQKYLRKMFEKYAPNKKYEICLICLKILFSYQLYPGFHAVRAISMNIGQAKAQVNHDNKCHASFAEIMGLQCTLGFDENKKDGREFRLQTRVPIKDEDFFHHS